MAKVRFKTGTNDVIKAKYASKKLFKIVLFAFCCTSLLLSWATYRLYIFGDFNAIISKTTHIFNELTTYYKPIESFIKGLF